MSNLSSVGAGKHAKRAGLRMQRGGAVNSNQQQNKAGKKSNKMIELNAVIL